MRQNEVRGANDLQRRASRATGVRGADKQGRENRTKSAQHPVHQVLRRPSQGLELGGRLALMHVIPAQDLENDLVQAAAEVGDPRRERILDEDSRLDVRGQPDVRGFDRTGRVEARVRNLHGKEVLEDPNEHAEMGFDPVATRPFALFHDQMDRPARALPLKWVVAS